MSRRRTWSGDYRTAGYYRGIDNALDKLDAEQARKRREAEEAAKAAGDASTKDQADSKGEQAAEKGSDHG